MPSSSSKNGERQRITKTEKIAELQSKLKLLTKENKSLQEELKKASLKPKPDSKDTTRNKAHDDQEKLKEALRALKRVTIKQEMSLATLRQKSKQRRSEIEQKDQIILTLQAENEAYRICHEKMKENDNNDAVSVLRARLADLELELAKEKRSEKLKDKERGGLSSLGRGVARTTSSDSGSLSIMSGSSSLVSTEDFARMKKDLAKRTEKITNLQYELEGCREEIHDLKQRNNFGNSFPMTPAQDVDDLFEDDDIDDVWEAF